MNHDEFFLHVSAMLGAHERLIRDLLVNVIGRIERPLDSFDAYAKRIKVKPTFADFPQLHPVEADQMNQMIAEALDRTLAGTREDLKKALVQSYQQRRKPPPTFP